MSAPLIIAFSVLDTDVERSGGQDALSGVFAVRLERFLANRHSSVRKAAEGHAFEVAGKGRETAIVHLRAELRFAERAQWAIETMPGEPHPMPVSELVALHAGLTELVIAWQEVEDVDAVRVLTR